VRIEPILLDEPRWSQESFPDMISVVLTSSTEDFAVGLYTGHPSIFVPNDSIYSLSRVSVIKEKGLGKHLPISLTILIDTTKWYRDALIKAMIELSTLSLHKLPLEDFLQALRRDVYYTIDKHIKGIKCKEYRIGSVPAWGMATLDSDFLIVFSDSGVLDRVVPEFWKQREEIIERLEETFPWFRFSPRTPGGSAPMDFGHIQGCLFFGSLPIVPPAMVVPASSLGYEIRFAFCVERRDSGGMPIEDVLHVERVVAQKMMNGAAVWYIDTKRPKAIGFDFRPPYDLEEVEQLLAYCLFRLSRPKEQKEILEHTDLSAKILVTELSL